MTHEHEHHHVHDDEHEHHHDQAHHHHHADEQDHAHLGDDEHAAVHFRESKDAFMRLHPQSPVPEAERSTFSGLSYYPYDPALHLSLPLERDVSAEPITMETSTGDQRTLHRVGKVRFEVEGQPAELTIFGEEDELFVPMRDATSGKETYGAGRYLEPTLVDENTVDLDFNYLYNPFCAYNPGYSCPLPPAENWLRVPIRAGETTYVHAGE